MTDATNDDAKPSRGFLLIISGPSGVGKSSITNALLQRLDADLSISMTTRPQAANDVDGQHYFFVDTATFEKAIQDDQLLEHAVYAGNFYGTPRKFVEDKLNAGRIVILEIDVEGAHQVKQKMPEAYAIFIDPPSEQALADRLRSRKRDDENTILKRLGLAKREIHFAHKSEVYDSFVVNEEFDHALNEVEKLVRRRLEKGREGTLFD